MAQKAQSVIFSKEEGDWSAEKARTWLGEHDLRSDKMDETDASWRFRQFDPEQCVAGSFQTLTEDFPAGVSMVSCDAPEEQAIQDPEVEPKLEAAVLQVVEEPRSLLDPRVLAMLMDRAVKVTDEEYQVRKGYDSEVAKDTRNNGRIRMRMTTDREDRVGDVIEVGGWVFDNYRRNPIVLFNHEYGEVGGSPPSQGRSLAVTTRKHAVENDVEFHRKTRFNEELYQMYGGGYMKTGSVGFWPLAAPEEREASNGRRGLRFTKQDLLEFSLVAVPANPDAYQLAMKKGIVRPVAVEYLVSQALPLAARQGKGKTAAPTAAPGSGDGRTTTARLAAALVLMRAKFTNRITGVTK